MEKKIKRNRSWLAPKWAAAILACSFASTAQFALADDAATPLEVFGRLPTLEHVAISPDGTKLAFVQTNGDQRSLFVKPLDKSEVLGGVRVGDAKLRGVE